MKNLKKNFKEKPLEKPKPPLRTVIELELIKSIDLEISSGITEWDVGDIKPDVIRWSINGYGDACDAPPSVELYRRIETEISEEAYQKKYKKYLKELEHYNETLKSSKIKQQQRETRN